MLSWLLNVNASAFGTQLDRSKPQFVFQVPVNGCKIEARRTVHNLPRPPIHHSKSHWPKSATTNMPKYQSVCIVGSGIAGVSLSRCGPPNTSCAQQSPHAYLCVQASLLKEFESPYWYRATRQERHTALTTLRLVPGAISPALRRCYLARGRTRHPIRGLCKIEKAARAVRARAH